MSIPEIIHRCSSCGASLKTALFCPQCGKAATPTAVPPIPVAAEERSVAAQNLQNDSATSVPPSVALGPKPGPPKTVSAPVSAGREMFERKLKPRVDQLRHASSVVLEEAAYDPSVRFVLVVAVLFLLFLALLLLNKWLG